MDELDAVIAEAATDPVTAIDRVSWLGDAIDRDAAAGLFSAWGRSTVIDENLGEAVIGRPLFEALHARAGMTAAWPVGNAGLLHTYAYLLSTTQTPYGLKRDRWLDDALATACGRDAKAFVPWASGRTLLARATDAANEIADSGIVTRRSLGPGAPAEVIALSATAGSAALVYALETDRRYLMTMFPVGDASALLTQLASEPVRLRWNAVGDGSRTRVQR